MASQAVLFAETIMAMKKAKKRRAYGATTFTPPAIRHTYSY